MELADRGTVNQYQPEAPASELRPRLVFTRWRVGLIFSGIEYFPLANSANDVPAAQLKAAFA